MEDIYICEHGQRAYEPEEVVPGGIRRLKTFHGYTVDLRVQEFRRVRIANYRNGINKDRYIEFVPFASPKGEKLLAQMHQAVTR